MPENDPPLPESLSGEDEASPSGTRSSLETVSAMETAPSDRNSSASPPIATDSIAADSNRDAEAMAASEALLKLALSDLQQRRQQLSQEVEELSNRKKQLEEALRASFAGQSDAMARRVKGFQEYLTGALQDLAHSVEQLDLVVQPMVVQPSPLDQASEAPASAEQQPASPAVADTFKPDADLIKKSLQRFEGQPDVYADSWTLRRSLDNKDIALLEDWFLCQGGRGAQPSRGTRTRNILVAAGLISILGELYGDRFQTLVLAGQPERLGEWRRGLQDCLGLGREDFGPQSGIVLFERASALIERADRLEDRGDVPMILIDAAEGAVEIPVLQFPLWLAFAAGPDERFDEDELL